MKRIFAAILAVCLLLGVSFPAIAKETEEKKIVVRDQDGIQLSVTLEVNETEYLWKLHYESIQNDFVITSLRVSNQEEILKINHNESWVEDDDHWITTSTNELRESTLHLTTPQEITSISVDMMFNKDITQANQYVVEVDQFLEDDKDELVNDIIETDNETILVIDDVSKLDAVAEQILNLSNGIDKPYNDPFNYTPNVSGGIYPTHGSGFFINEDRTIITDSKTTKNFDYSTTSPIDKPAQAIAYGKTLDFLSGYHYSPNVDNQGRPKAGVGLLNKKTVKPTGDPNKFDMEVDIIGGATPINHQIDVMLIIDKSASMNQRPDGRPANWINSDSRWSLLKNAVGKLATQLLTKDNDIQIGMTSFGSYWNGSITTHMWTEVANFNTPKEPLYFTNRPADVIKNSILSESRTPSGSGTPTFVGIQSGMETTNKYSRPNALKFVILVTDGVATYGPGDHFVSLDSRTNFTASSKKNDVDTYEFSNPQNKVLYIGTGYEESTNNKPLNPLLSLITSKTLEHVSVLKNKDEYKDYKYMSLGFATTKESSPPKTEEPARQMNLLLNQFQNSGRFDATSQTELNKAFEEIKRRIAGYEGIFVLGEFIDPMSDQVNFVEGSLKTSALTLTYDSTNNIYSGITAISKINTDGNVNENFPEYANDIIVNMPDGLDQTIIHLSDMNLGSLGNDRMGFRINYTVELKEEFRNSKFYQTNGPTRAVAFNFLNPIGFAVPSIRVPTTDFTFKKVGVDEIALKGARFGINIKGKNEVIEALSDDFGNVSFIGLGAGTYELEELDAPAGYQILNEKIEFTIEHGSPPYQGGLVTIIDPKYKQDGNIVIKNDLKPYSLNVFKVDATGKELIGSSFNLSNQDNSYNETIDGTELSEFQFLGMTWGTYTLIETKSPTGYVIMKPVIIDIGKDGTVRLDGSPSETVDNTISYTAVNYQKGILPSTGSTHMFFYTVIPITMMVLASGLCLYWFYRRWRYRL